MSGTDRVFSDVLYSLRWQYVASLDTQPGNKDFWPASKNPGQLSKQVTSPGQNVGETDLDNVTHDFNRVLMSMVFK